MLIWIVLSTIFIWHSKAFICNLQNSKISCTDIKTEDLYTDMYVVITPEDVLDFNITNASISSIDETVFMKYKSIHTLYLKNVQLKNINEGALSNLKFLKHLYLPRNLLKEFNSNIFNTSNVLHTLDLSNNLIQDLNDFNISLFPSLTLMNISSNKLKYLPEQILKRLNIEEEFYLIIDKNPWDCSNTTWLKNSGTSLKAAFCEELILNDVQNSTDFRAIALEEQPVRNVNYKNERNTEKNLITLCGYETRCFSYCVFWFIGGIWLGVILGNACKIKNLICTPSISFMQEQDTQYERTHLRSKEH